jgi:hypothetical protein
MQVSGHLYVPAALPPRKEPPVPIGQEAEGLQNRSGRGGEDWLSYCLKLGLRKSRDWWNCIPHASDLLGMKHKSRFMRCEPVSPTMIFAFLGKELYSSLKYSYFPNVAFVALQP